MNQTLHTMKTWCKTYIIFVSYLFSFDFLFFFLKISWVPMLDPPLFWTRRLWIIGSYSWILTRFCYCFDVQILVIILNLWIWSVICLDWVLLNDNCSFTYASYLVCLNAWYVSSLKLFFLLVYALHPNLANHGAFPHLLLRIYGHTLNYTFILCYESYATMNYYLLYSLQGRLEFDFG